MQPLERILGTYLHALRLDSVKQRVLALTVLATLLPSGTTSWLLYTQHKAALTRSIHEDLRRRASSVARELDTWLAERLNGLRLCARALELSPILKPGQQEDGTRALARHRAQGFLEWVQTTFSDYEALAVLDLTGTVLVASPEPGAVTRLSAHWPKQAALDRPLFALAHWDQHRGKPVMTLAVPLATADGRSWGSLAATLQLGALEAALRNGTQNQSRYLFILKPDGTRMLSSRPKSDSRPAAVLPLDTTRALYTAEPGTLHRFTDEATEVLAVMHPLPRLGWGVVAAQREEEAFRGLAEFRDRLLAATGSLLLAVGGISYLLSLTIIGPLTRLTQEAAQVAGGDLPTPLAVGEPQEISQLKAVLHTMVSSLREAQQALSAANLALNERNAMLEAMSATDALTGLYNRRRLMEVLLKEIARHERIGRPFALVMADLDRFKPYNDTYGHLAGDALLSKFGSILHRSLRTVDVAARYGGDEFVILLPDQELTGAVEVAERIRQRIAEETGDPMTGRPPITASFGIATFPAAGRTPEQLLASADRALYEAKHSGRNGVRIAASSQPDP